MHPGLALIFNITTALHAGKYPEFLTAFISSPTFFIFILSPQPLQPTVQPKINAHTRSGARSCCTARTAKPPQEANHIFAVYMQELSNTRSQKTLQQEATKITASLKIGTSRCLCVHQEEVCGVCRLFIQTPFFVVLNLSSR